MPDTATTPIWRPDRSVRPPPWNLPSLPLSVGRGLLCRCPVCGEGRLFDGYLTVVEACAVCATPLGLARADDAPPYFTIFAVGHIILPLMLWLEIDYTLSSTVMIAIFVPLALLLTVALLRPIKGGTVGLMLKLGLVKPDDED